MERIYNYNKLQTNHFYWIYNTELQNKKVFSREDISLEDFKKHHVYGPIETPDIEYTEDELVKIFKELGIKTVHQSFLKVFYLKISKNSPFKINDKILKSYDLYRINDYDYELLKDICSNLKKADTNYYSKSYNTLEILEYILLNNIDGAYKDEILRVFKTYFIDDDGSVSGLFNVTRKSGKLKTSLASTS